jgi:hypothetical protein
MLPAFTSTVDIREWLRPTCREIVGCDCFGDENQSSVECNVKMSTTHLNHTRQCAAGRLTVKLWGPLLFRSMSICAGGPRYRSL